jgi:P pilus assembly chaperone PapD
MLISQPKLWLVGLLAVGFSLPAFALGDLLVTPTRVVLEGRQRSAAINLVNSGKEASTYRIMLINQRMNEDGAIEEIKDPTPEDRTAEELIRFSPRQVILPAGGAQVVRVQLLHLPNVEEGEYRSHLLFRGVPAVSETKSATDSKGISVQLIPIYGISIPVIVRHGNTSAQVSLSDFKVRNHKACVRLNRTGNRSVYGNILLDFTSKAGERKIVQQVNGIAVYVPNASRLLTFPLSQDFRHGKMRIAFQENVEVGAPISAETTIEIP